METTVITEKDLNTQNIKKLFQDVVVIPTETVYGLAADIYNEEALLKIYEIKGRPRDNPLIVHVSSLEMLRTFVEGDIPDVYMNIIREFWPGPLTLIFKCKSNVSNLITCGLSTVAVRMPSNKTTLKIIEELGHPIAAPSANLSGKPSPTTVAHVLDDLNGRVKYIIDGGNCSFGVESTVINCLVEPNVILRPGSITREALLPFIGESLIFKTKVESEDDKVVSPGMKYRHYSPEAPLILFKGEKSNLKVYLKEHLKNFIQNENGFTKIGCMIDFDLNDAFLDSNKNIEFVNLSSNNEEQSLENRKIYFYNTGKSSTEFAKNIFFGLRELDKKCDLILVLGCKKEFEGRAVMDRLEKAAIRIIVEEGWEE